MKFIVIAVVLLSLFGVNAFLWSVLEEPHKEETAAVITLLLFLPTIMTVGRYVLTGNRGRRTTSQRH
jgi:hypothetical protein